MPPDPADFDRMAARLERAALQYDDTGSSVTRLSDAMNWIGGAADKFRKNADSFDGNLKSAAKVLRQLAEGLRSGATAIRDAQARAAAEDD